MNTIKKIIVCNFVFVCGVQQCLTNDLSFQNAKMFCTVFDNNLREFLHNLQHSVDDSCYNSNSYKLVTVTGRVTTIYEYAVIEFSNINGIILTEVGLQEIHPNGLKNFPNLQVLGIDNNELAEIKSGVFDNLSVSYLFLYNNSISTLDDKAFHNLPNLTILSLERNKLKTIRKGVFDNIFLWMLNLMNNQIDEIEYGAFDNIHPEPSKSKILIYLSNNNLREINAKVFNIKHLVTLKLDHNSISEIRPGDLENLPKLRDLVLTGNKLQAIPNGVFSGSNIEKLDLSHNQIITIDTQAFDSMKQLLEVKINHNKLSVWNSDWFSGSWSSRFFKYSKLDASHNNIGEIPDNAFENFRKNNFIVRLQWNTIRKISDSAFSGLTNVHILDLSYNEISEWNETLLNRFKGIKTVDLGQNEYKCRHIFIGSNSVFVPGGRILVLYDCVQLIQNQVVLSDVV